jgi:acyl-CoA thioester hydrolase
MIKSYIQDLEEWKREFTFYTPIKVRFSETDLYGHMNNTVPIVYFEQARIEFLNKLEIMQEWLDNKINNIIVIADIQCDYVKQVYFDEQLKVYVKVAKIGTSSLDLHYLGVDQLEQICFTGRGTIVQINQETGKSIPWKERQLSKLTEQQRSNNIL